MNNKHILLICALILISANVFSLDLGRAWMDKTEAYIFENGDWTVYYEVGKMGISVDGCLKVQFPLAWESDPWGTFKKPQTEYPNEPHYVSATTNRKGTKFDIDIVKLGVDGQHDRYSRVFDVYVREVPLEPGDIINVTYADTRAPNTAETDTIRVAVDPSGNEIFFVLKEFPEFTVKAGAAEKFLIFAPSQAVAGEKVEIRIVALDDQNNCADSFTGIIETSGKYSSDKKIYTLNEKNKGRLTINTTFRKPGTSTVRVKVKNEGLLYNQEFESNPISVSSNDQNLNRYWGDIHSHCGISKDGIGTIETAFFNARNVFCLDFYALADHSVGDKIAMNDWTEGITPEEWETTQKFINSYYDPGKFVTLLGYEWSRPAPYGHHNIYYRNTDEAIFDMKHHPTIESLWAKLENKEAFTIPHHSAIMWRGINSPYVDWSHQNDKLRPSVEIYSLHGASEHFNNPMKYEEYDFTPTSSNFGPYYARDGWAAGNYMSSMASSDNHDCRPGQPHGGLTCVLAGDLTRDAIFDAFMARHTYATTGARILLDFSINDRMMGEKLTLKNGQKPDIKIEVTGTGPLEYLELFKYNGTEWTTAKRWTPENTRTLDVTWTDDNPAQENIYYYRLKQKEQYFGRDVMAWSSPIWVNY